MERWAKTALVALVLGGGVAAGLTIGRTFDSARRTPEPPATLVTLQDSFAAVAAFAGPSVVHITTQVGATGDPWQRQGVGSGVIVSGEGHILTNHHVVDSGGERLQLLVRLGDGRDFPARVVGTDSETDLALLKIKAPADNPPAPIMFADSEKIRVGDWCLAIGSPFGYNHSVTVGVVSAKHRRAQLAQPYQDFIQTDAAINPGNSGGALVNLRGELVGINSAIVSETGGSDGVGFAIASNLVLWVKDQLVEHGRVRRGYLGVRMVDRDGPGGAVIHMVEPDSPAGTAGLKERDVLIEFDGKPVTGQSDVFFKVAEASPGSPVTVKVLRDKKEREFKVELAERPPVELRRLRRR
jgi:S1-C subfamily serine protease